MAINNIDFLRFNAYSMKELITRKLSEDTKFTDQIYEGSNLAILIDLVSYMYQCLVYVLNNAAAESMFSDTQIYENINRLVKMIGYHPKGIIPSSAFFYFNNFTQEDDTLQKSGKYRNYGILRYSYVATGKFDRFGNEVCFSTIKDRDITDDLEYKFQMFNGKWKLYDSTLIASGLKFETFILDDLKSDIENNHFVANNGIDVYVQQKNKQIIKFKTTTEEIFTNNNINDIKNFSDIYSKTEHVCSIRLNENKQFEIKFGDGIVGTKLNSGEKIFIFYLETNGYDGQINMDEYTESKLKNPIFSFNDSLELSDFVGPTFNKYLTTLEDVSQNPDIYLIDNSSDVVAEENVEEIRTNAPNWFKIGNRLITHDDFKYYFKNSYANEIIDIFCQNNWEYISTFYKWLYEMGINRENPDPRYYLNNSKLLRNGLVFADPADSNNIYLWTKLYAGKLTLEIKNSYKENIQNIKSLTIEPVFIDPIELNFALCAAPLDHAKKYFSESINNIFDPFNETYLEITIADNSIYVAAQIQPTIEKIIKDFFNVKNLQLGMVVNYNILYNKILEINGVKEVRTIWINSKTDPNGLRPRILDGLCFATWSNSLIENGDDLDISNTNKSLMPFQFPKLYLNSFSQKIKIIKKSINNLNKIQY